MKRVFSFPEVMFLVVCLILSALMSACQAAPAVTNTPFPSKTVPLPTDTAKLSITPEKVQTTAPGITSQPEPTPISKVILPGNAGRLAVVAQYGRGSIYDSPVFSPDGRLLAIPTSLGVDIYDNSLSHTYLHTLKTGGWVHKVLFFAGGTRLAAVARDVTIWDPKTASQLQEIAFIENEMNYYMDMAVAPDGSSLAIAYGPEDQVGVWGLRDGKMLFEGKGMSVEFSPDSQRLLTQRWNPENTSETLITLYSLPDSTLLKTWTGVVASFTPTGEILLEKGGRIQVIDPLSGSSQRAYNGQSAVISPDGQTLAVYNNDFVELYDYGTGTRIRNMDGVFDQAGNFVFSPDGKSLASIIGKCETPFCAFPNMIIVLWQVEDGAVVFQAADPGLNSYLAFQPDSQALLVSGPSAGRLVSRVDGRRLWEMEGYSPSFSGATISQDGRWLGTVGCGVMQIWDVRSGARVKELVSPGGGCGSEVNASFSPDGQLVAAASDLFRLADGEHLLTFEQRLESSFAVSNVQFSPDGKRLAIGFTDGRLALLDIPLNQVLFTFRQQGGSITSLSFSKDGEYLAAVASIPDYQVQVWNTRNGQAVFQIEGEFFDKVVFSPAGGFVATLAGKDEMDAYGISAGEVHLWNSESREMVAALDVEDAVSMAFSPDGELLVTGSKTGMLHLWQTSNGNLLGEYPAQPGMIIDVFFTSNGERLYSAGESGSVLAWEVAKP